MPFSFGIFLGSESYTEFNTTILPLIFFALICYAFTIRNYATGKYAQRWLTGIPFTICFFIAGYSFSIISLDQSGTYHFSKSGNAKVYMLEADGTVRLSSKGVKVLTKVKAVLDSSWKPCSGKLLLYIRDSARNEFMLRTGDILFVRCQAEEIKSPMNPGEFNYKKYLFQKGISTQAFVKINDIKVYEPESFSINRIASGLRESMLKRLRAFIPGREEAGVAGALLLGYEEWLDPQLENTYTGAGVLHVLCVSGMHVGLIYLILSWPMGWMEKKRLTRHLRNALLIFMIWFYALLTGFSPSVIRASAMITFVITGKWLNKESEMANILCGSCLCMFLFDPLLLKSAGFQLSFLAVCGIVFLHPLIVSLPGISNRFLFKVWELISISVSAQIATFPVSIFYFHQFPNYFLPANMIIIPLSTLIMYSGLTLLVTDWIPGAGLLFGTITSYGISFLNNTVKFFGKLPGAITDNIFINETELIVLYILILLITLWVVLKNRGLFFAALGCIIIFLGCRINLEIKSGQEQLFTIYHDRLQIAISIVQEKNALLLHGAKESGMPLCFKNDLISKQIDNFNNYTISPDTAIQISTAEKTILICHGWKNHFKLDNNFHKTPHYLVLSGHCTISAEEILKQLKPGLVLFDATFKNRSKTELQGELKQAGISYYDISENGAYLTGDF